MKNQIKNALVQLLKEDGRCVVDDISCLGLGEEYPSFHIRAKTRHNIRDYEIEYIAVQHEDKLILMPGYRFRDTIMAPMVREKEYYARRGITEISLSDPNWIESTVMYITKRRRYKDTN